MKMVKELILTQIVERDGKKYPVQITIPPQGLVLQRFSLRGHVGGTIELCRVDDNKVHVLGTWGAINIREKRDGYKARVFASKEYKLQVSGQIYLGPDGIYQLQ